MQNDYLISILEEKDSNLSSHNLHIKKKKLSIYWSSTVTENILFEEQSIARQNTSDTVIIRHVLKMGMWGNGMDL